MKIGFHRNTQTKKKYDCCFGDNLSRRNFCSKDEPRLCMRPMDEMSVIYNMCDDFPKHLTKISLSPSPAYFEKGKNITLQKCHVTILYNCYDSITRRSNLVIPIFSPFFFTIEGHEIPSPDR